MSSGGGISSRRERRTLTVVGAIVTTLAVGCTSVPPTVSPSVPVTSPPSGGSPSPVAIAGGTLLVGQDHDIETLDPAIGIDVYSLPWERLIFETLITYDADTNLVPRLAEAMPEVSDDGLTLTFTIRDGVNFVLPDGSVLREVTADDFVYSLNRVLDPDLTPTASPWADTFFAVIEGADAVLSGEAETASGLRAVDERTLEITLGEPDPAFLSVLAMPFGSVVPREHAGEDTSAFSQRPVGTGPYLFAEWSIGERARFVRNPNYWNGELAGPAEIDVTLGISADIQLQRVQAGTLHVMTDSIPSGQFETTVGDPRWADFLHRRPQITTNFLAMDTAQEGPLGEVAVRQAINHAIDKANIIRIKNGRGVPAACIFPPLLPGHDPTCDPYPYDVDRARELLEQADYGDGFETELYADEAEPEPQVAQSIQQDLAAIGIDATLVLQPFGAIFDLMTQHQTPLFLSGWVMDFPDPADFVEPVLTCASRGEFNPAWYCNEDVDEMVLEARTTTDPDARLALYQQIQDAIMADAPWVPLDHPEAVVLVDPTVTGFELHPVWRFDFERLRIDE